MKIFRIILGILMAIFGLTCIFTPLKTAFGVNIMIAILTVVYGVIGIVWSIKNKTFGIGFVFYILSVAFGICVFFLPMLMAITNHLIARLVAGWIVVQGIVTIITAIMERKVFASKKWIIQVIMGVIGIVIGIYSFMHPLLFGVLAAGVIGLLLGIYFLQAGISIIFLPSKAE